jgi:plasmid maintenance system antidote protein VapI
MRKTKTASRIHIGSIIKEKVAEKKISITAFAKAIYCERTTVYHIFKSKSIDVERLFRISEVLGYNFYEEVYLKEYNLQIFHSANIFIAIEIDKDMLPVIELPEGAIRLIKDTGLL